MEINLVGEGLKFMALGMLIVFAFLAILVQIMKLQAKMINKYFPEKAPKTPLKTENIVEDDSPAITAAIIAAITEFRKQS